jgi:hypothetical protein
VLMLIDQRPVKATLDQEHAGVGQVVHIQKLARGLAFRWLLSPTPQLRRQLQRQRSHILMKNAIARPQPLAIFFAMPSSVQANGHACTHRPHPTHQVPP